SGQEQGLSIWPWFRGSRHQPYIHITIVTATPDPAMDDHIGCFETIMANMMDIMREMWASSSTAALLSTNPPFENQDADEEHLD
ncbi:UNVERIFIED_CONTAM: hypothetical protein Sindi_1798800, partial [Sesamum indicum]